MLHKKRIKILIAISIVIIITAIITFIVLKHNRNNKEVAPIVENTYKEETEEKEETIKIENNIQFFTVGKPELIKEGNNKYLQIEVLNNSQEDKFNILMNIEILDKNNVSILKTGYIKDVLLKSMKDILYIKITDNMFNLLSKENYKDYTVIINENKN